MTLDLKTKRIIDLEVGDVLYYPTTEESIGVVVPFQHQAGKMSSCLFNEHETCLLLFGQHWVTLWFNLYVGDTQVIHDTYNGTRPDLTEFRGEYVAPLAIVGEVSLPGEEIESTLRGNLVTITYWMPKKNELEIKGMTDMVKETPSYLRSSNIGRVWTLT